MSPISVNTTAAPGGNSYSDIRVGEVQVHQILYDVSSLTGVDDANGSLPPGLPILANGNPVTGGADVAYGVVGPEPVQLGAVDHFANIILAGVLNRDAIEDNLGRVLSANELAAIALCPQIRLV